ncbi:MAG: diacylglycerol kinase family lipid kinase [Ruminococcus sp.]|nr:diacylglycerol kinase family lipid kinase [Ruminococcus sp.]
MTFNIILNPAGASGKTEKLWKSLEPVFASAPDGYKLFRSTKERSVGDIARELTSRGEETALVVIGGDGTLNEALNGIADFENTLFGFIPCGTGNDMQRDMGLPKNKGALAQLIIEGHERRQADIGELTFYGEEGVIRRLFNISSDVGFGAATCAFVDRTGLKSVLNRLGLGRLIYLVGALRVCFTARPAQVRITCNGRTRLYRRCLSAIVMNHCHEGGGFKFCPNADFTDGLFDLCIGNGLTKLGFLRMLPNAYLGKHLRLRGIYSERASEVTIRSDRPLWAHTDGEVMGQTKKVKMRIVPEKLRLMV